MTSHVDETRHEGDDETQVILAIAADGPAAVEAGTEQVDGVARELARVVGAAVRPALASDGDGWTVPALDDSDVLFGVCALPATPDSPIWRLAEQSVKPLALVPAGVASPLELTRALVPLDGTRVSADAIAPVAGRLSRGGVRVVALHVFDESTVPAYWDQAAHAPDAFATEFVARFCAFSDTGLELRSGIPAEQIADLAREASTQLIVMAWSRRRDDGRAATLRLTLGKADVPVLLVPILLP